ncbi:hypothetical protein OROMI_028923 [Orobanche minor]
MDAIFTVKRSNVAVRFFVALCETWEGTSKKSTRHDSNPLLAFASSSTVGRKASSQDTISLPKENSPTLDKINLLVSVGSMPSNATQRMLSEGVVLVIMKYIIIR